MIFILELLLIKSKGVPDVVRKLFIKLKSEDVARGKKSIDVHIVLRL